MFILCLVTLLSQLDRQITTIIVTPLKKEFGISDTQFGLLHGYGFALTYAVFGVPFGRLVDRHSRRNLILFGLLAWSFLTAFSAFAGSYVQLLLLRTGVGIGEAVLAPAAYSLLADYFAPRQRGRATSVYYMAMSAGAGCSIWAGGLLLGLLPSGGLTLAGVVNLEPWRLLFLFTGLPGVFACLLMLTIKEPGRRGAAAGDTASLRAFLGYVWRNRTILSRISVASTLISAAGYGAAAWTPALLERRFGIPPASTAGSIGLAIIVGSVGGTLLSGIISDRLLARSEPSARTRPMLYGYLALLPSAFFGLVNEPWLAVVLFGLMTFGVGMVQGTVPVALQEAAPANLRGQIVALQLVIQGLCSIGLGPTLVGVISDRFFPSGQRLGWSLLVLMLPIALIGLSVCRFGLNADVHRRLDARRTAAVG